MSKSARVPYSQQFTPEQTPLRRLLPILRQYRGKMPKLKTAIASAFFSAKPSPAKLAGNTIISLRTYGVIDEDANLSSFGEQLLARQSDLSAAHDLLAKRILVDLNGMAIVEKVREMAAAAMKIELKSLPGERGQRGIEASRNSSDLSGILGWLRVANILNEYDVNEAKYAQLIGAPAEMLQALKALTGE